MTKQRNKFMKIRGLLLLIVGLILLVACTPSEAETPTAVTTPVTTATTLAAELVTTARPTSGPTATALPVPANPTLSLPTPFNTSTPPSITPTPITEWPFLENDVLFLVDNSLKLWDHENRELVLLLPSTAENPPDDNSYPPIPGDITDYQVSPDGQAVIVSRIITVEPRTHEFILIDLTTRQSRILVSPAQLSKPSFSPDGRQIAYITGAAESSNESIERYEVLIKDVFDEEPPQLMDYCFNKLQGDPVWVHICLRNQIVWSPDGRSLLWSDRRGALSFNLDTKVIETIKTHENTGLTGSAQLSEKFFFAEDWSPNGRFLRLTASGYEYYEEFIYDIDSRQIFEIPSSYSGLRPKILSIWLFDNRIFLTRKILHPFETHAEISRFDATNGNWIIESTSIFSTSDDNQPIGQTQLEDGSVNLAIINSQEVGSTAEFYTSEVPADGGLEFIQLPTVVSVESFFHIYWSPNGSGAILVQSFGNYRESLVEYVAIGEEVSYDLSIGFDVKSIYWLP